MTKYVVCGIMLPIWEDVIVRLIGREKLRHLKGTSEQNKKWLVSWVSEVMGAHWKLPSDVIQQFPKAKHEGEGRFMFPVADCNWTIHLLITFPQGVALVTNINAKD